MKLHKCVELIILRKMIPILTKSVEGFSSYVLLKIGFFRNHSSIKLQKFVYIKNTIISFLFFCS